MAAGEDQTAAAPATYGTSPTDAASQEGAALAYGPGYANLDANLGNANAQYLGNQGQGEAGAFAQLGANALGQAQNEAGGFQALGNQALTQGLPAQQLAQENQALGYLGNAAAGNGPSAAQAQLQSGVDQSIQAQMAAANSAKGNFGLADAGYNAAQNAGQIQAQAANAAAQLRAQEQQAAESQYLTGSTNALGQAVGQQEYGLTTALGAQGQATGAAQTGLTTALGAQGASANDLLAYEQAGLGNQLGLQTLGQGGNLGFSQLGAQIASGTGQIGVQNMAQQNTINAANAQNSENLVGTGISAGGAALSTGIKASNQNQNSSTTPVGANTTTATTDGTPSGSPAATYNPNQTGGTNTPDTGDGSDERVKNASSFGSASAAADDFMDAATPRTFSYKDPSYEPKADGEGGTYLGFMAQDLEKSPAGRQAIVHDSRGMKRVNPSTLSFANTAAIGRLHDRMKALEAKFCGRSAA